MSTSTTRNDFVPWVRPRQAAVGLLVACLSSVYLAHAMAAGETKAAHASLTAASLTAAQIVEKHVAARGGLQAWRAVQTISWNGKLEAGAGDSAARSARFVQSGRAPTSKKDLVSAPPADAKKDADKQVLLPFMMAMERPRKSRMELEFAGKTAVQVYDGAQGWKVRPYLNRNEVEPFTADELKSEESRVEIEGPLIDYAAKGTRVALDGIEKVEGHDAYKLTLTFSKGTVQHIWIDAHSFLDVKVEGVPRRMDGRMHDVWVYQRDFRSVQGLMVPFALETAVDGYRDTHKMLIDKVSVNPRLNASLFTKPSGA